MTHLTDDLNAALCAQRIETPSWGYGNSGTRFKTFAAPGAARDVYEKLDDAAEVHRLTGIAPSVALHIPWDEVDDYAALGRYARERGVGIGAINPNVFQDDVYKLGSVTSPFEDVREQAVQHLLECVEVMRQTGSRDLSLWFADGTNYAGQDDLRRRKHAMRAALKRVHDALPEDGRMLVEYKLFEPAFYYTDLFDWGAAYAHCVAIGDRAQVLVDLGHHAQGVNIEGIVAFLLDEGRLGGFHFNARRYADDDLIVGTTNPLELFSIYAELVAAGHSDDALTRATAQNVAYMIDQSHNIEPKVEAMLQSVLNCQEAYAKALLIDRGALSAAQQTGDVLAAHRALTDAFRTDVRPLLAEWRSAHGLPTDPIAAHRASGYQQTVARERGTAQGGGGYPVKDKVTAAQ
ncbi:L-rhamnose isomerase/sugar isomerase [Deinococcus metalli]|uniref:L-rhamnose isomerase n=1 Tax=Deinococcus metalli TaxID=1141878 RepID=A0A7W8KCM2_9DEIO|nr:L-rhamnose isomerase [Deinococcus metalli]MBB5375745.1 L-rhamnose isomerase/sugar isomerase [Deinococcus metalli]GHF37375.1 L-rhamnose isomerase [Deinococcus metalli]